ncbi:uncharacterized protein BX663DRAFT_548725 [Cokeromyces recurvatus]|uniref:uncharacterized protein n=1 Tax=Cokeromyces recurvatus TaxID=90255 RepID=UPI00221E7F55|nr:uncharacterized protein BX663DRAFT_548725 [Cokeromyces recurvatus]KAI7906557.1 hypothetical protein BX663DRAFT_548725 [Cokeromyces recurvatus]
MSATKELELVNELEEKIKEILNDDILSDVPTFPTLEELDALIAIEKGQAYRVTIERPPLPSFRIIVQQSSTVRDIKKLIKLQVERIEKNEHSGRKRKISWKYIWHSYCLLFSNKRLLEDDAVVSQLGIKQNSVLRFTRRVHEKGQHRKAQRY